MQPEQGESPTILSPKPPSLGHLLILRMLACLRPLRWARCASRARFATVADLLKRKDAGHVESVLIPETQPLSVAITMLDRVGVRALIVVDASRRVLGLITAHDVLRALRLQRATACSSPLDAAPVRDAMTAADAMFYSSPTDDIAESAALMAELRIHHLPVLSDGKLQGMITLQDIAAEMLQSRLGGKAAAVHALTRHGHVGVHVSQPLRSVPRHATPLFLRTGAAAHPRATPPGRLSEDAFFALSVPWPVSAANEDTAGETAILARQAVTFIGVADGVGSWHAVGVDPRLYARGLMTAAAEYVLHSAALVESSGPDTSNPSPPPGTPDVLEAAWEAVTKHKIVGSATVSLVTLDSRQRMFVWTECLGRIRAILSCLRFADLLSVSGVGDCGVLVLRDALFGRGLADTKRGTRYSAWRVRARSSQQLRSFNQPCQLGWAPGDDERRFETPKQAEMLRVPVELGDVIICASDGLFDNLTEADILETVDEWDATRADGAVSEVALASPASTSEPATLLDGSGAAERVLAIAMAAKARSMSLDRTRDGPFARLAKEADILWKYGGRPDDITVVVAVVSPTAPAMPFRCVAPTATSGTSKGVPPSTGVPEPLAGHTCPEDVLADAIQRWHSSMS